MAAPARKAASGVAFPAETGIVGTSAMIGLRTQRTRSSGAACQRRAFFPRRSARSLSVSAAHRPPPLVPARVYADAMARAVRIRDYAHEMAGSGDRDRDGRGPDRSARARRCQRTRRMRVRRVCVSSAFTQVTKSIIKNKLICSRRGRFGYIPG